jgi:coenzyme F420-reducing hydrogenase beta subunit
MTENRINKVTDECKDKESLTQLLAKLNKEIEEIPREAIKTISKRLNIPVSEILRLQELRRLEHEFLKGTKDEEIGVHSDLFSARSNVDGQDGGMASALLSSGIESGAFDAAIVVTRKNGYEAEVIVAENSNDAIAARGTKYLRARTTPKLKELIDKGIKNIAIVGTPCEVLAARKIQQTVKRENPDAKIAIVAWRPSTATN